MRIPKKAQPWLHGLSAHRHQLIRAYQSGDTGDLDISSLRTEAAGWFKRLPSGISGLFGFGPSVIAAIRVGNGVSLARLILQMEYICVFDWKATAAKETTAKLANGGRAASAARKAEGKNALALVEAWERQYNDGRPLTPRSPKAHIAKCGDDIRKSEVTVRNALYARHRQAQSSR